MSMQHGSEPDFNEVGFNVVQQATGQAEKSQMGVQRPGRPGGIKGGVARSRKLSAEEKPSIAQKAANVRWAAKPGETRHKHLTSN